MAHRDDLGILFVHGIGLQARGSTLIAQGEALQNWLVRWLQGAGGSDSHTSPLVSDAVLQADPADPSAPAHAELRVKRQRAPGSPVQDTTWLLAESWWAEAFAPPTYVQLLRWCFLVVPWTLTAHFGTRLVRAAKRATVGRPLSALALNVARAVVELAYFLSAVAFVPLVVLFLLLLLILGLLPIAQVRSFVGVLQRGLAATLGDSFVLLDSPIQAAAIVGRVRRDLAWLSARCRSVGVVAHFQGCTIAHRALREGAPDNVRLFATVGSGLNKLADIESLRGSAAKWVPWVAFPGLVMMAKSLPALLKGLEKAGWVFLLACGTYVLLMVLASSGEGLKSKDSWRRRPLSWWVRLGVALLAVGVLIFGYVELFAAVGGEWLSLVGGGAILLVLAAKPALEGRKKRVQDLKLPSHVRWVDYYASADPVPNGPLADEPTDFIKSFEVHNLCSSLSDHTSYWSNSDGFVGRIACEAAGLAKLSLDSLRQGDRERLQVAYLRRRLRARWLAGARMATLLFAALVPVGLWRILPSIAAPLVRVLGRAIDVLPFIEIPRLLPTPLDLTSRAIGLAAVLVSALIGYYALYATWSWWNRSDIDAFFARRDYSPVGIPFGMFAALLLAELEAATLIVLGWTEGIAHSAAQAGQLGAVLALFSSILLFLRTVHSWVLFGQFIARVALRAAILTVLFAPGFIYGASHHLVGTPESLAPLWWSLGVLLGLAASRLLFRTGLGTTLRSWFARLSWSGPEARERLQRQDAIRAALGT